MYSPGATLNNVGLRRRGFTDDELLELKRAYRTIFRKGLPLKTALVELEDTYSESKNVMYLVDFIKNSKRGIVK